MLYVQYTVHFFGQFKIYKKLKQKAALVLFYKVNIEILANYLKCLRLCVPFTDI